MKDNEYGQAVEKLQQVLRHYGCAEEFPLLTEFPTLTELVNAYQSQPGDNHWFDPETLEAHGSLTIRMLSPGIIIEEQENTYQVARNPVKYWKITCWIRTKKGRITALTIQAFDDYSDALIFGRNIAQVWADHSNPNYPAPR
jgi:hypothetical protein